MVPQSLGLANAYARRLAEYQLSLDQKSNLTHAQQWIIFQYVSEHNLTWSTFDLSHASLAHKFYSG